MSEDLEIRDMRDAIVRHSEAIKTLFKDAEKRDVTYQTLWDGLDKISNRLWWMIGLVVGAQGAVILLLISLLNKG